MQVEVHNGLKWDVQTEIEYNGLGQRLSMDAAGVIAHYVIDGDQLLTANSAGNTTFYLYGLGAIAEKTNAWSYSLPDGTNTSRQLSNLNGDITLSARYTPWGDTLDAQGTGNFTFGYFGGVMDAATGLMYVGNGQYYDPATGRFLTRDAKPNQPNPYVPWDPTGAIIGPLGVAALFFAKKKKGSKWDTLLLFSLVVVIVGMTLAACGGTPTSTPLPPAVMPTAVPDETPVPVPPGEDKTPEAGNDSGNITPTPTPPITVTLPDCPTATLTPTASSIDEELRLVYQIAISVDFPEGYKAYILEAVKKVDQRFADTMGWARTTAFARVYGIGYLFQWGCDSCGVSAFAYTEHDHIEFKEFFTRETERNPRFVIHELGHAFDQKVCEVWTGRICGDDINLLSPIREQLKQDVANMGFLNRFDYGNTEDLPGVPAFSGFAGGQNQWQFAISDQTDFSLYKGEVWADMFLGWMYENLATDRQNYMNREMPKYLSWFN